MDTQVNRLSCAVDGCDGLVRAQPCGALECDTCHAHVTVWRLPETRSALQRCASPALRRALFSHALLLFALLGAFAGATTHEAALASERSELAAERGARIDRAALLAALRSGSLPKLESLPAFYADPQRFLSEPAQRSAGSPYLDFWLTQNRTQRLEILRLCTEAAHPLLLPLLAEISWHTIAQENDLAVASSLGSALHACARDYLELAILCMEHIANESAFSEVADDARTAIQGLRHRASVYGR
ncbi:MAG: hypothetical protein JNM84_03765 [Planctomycetes bacterium]|nr:hypothetical protein [Planctomycetota bacterium]